MSPRPHRTGPARIASTERAARAVALRRQGHTFDQIAVEVGYGSRQAAHGAVTRYLDRVRAEATEEAADLFETDLGRTEQLWASLAPGIAAGSPRAVEVALKILERRARMLGHDDYEARIAAVAEASVRIENKHRELIATAVINVVQRLELPDETKRHLALEVGTELDRIIQPEERHTNGPDQD